MNLSTILKNPDLYRDYNPIGYRNAFKRAFWAATAVRCVPDGWNANHFRALKVFAERGELYKTPKANKRFLEGWEKGENK
jgi:hypothetical protein